ncbi:MAG TPA: glycosyltransferase family 4 protein [Acidimicrobiia bacterium]
MTAVLQVVTDTDRRGAQTFAVDLGDALHDLGATVRTVALAPGSTGGLAIPCLGPTRLGPATLRELRRAAARADVVVAHGSTTLPACALATMGTGAPFVYRQISDSRVWADTTLRRARVRLALSRAARVVTLWNGAADVMVTSFHVPRETVEVIPNGVPADRFAPPRDGETEQARIALGLSPHRRTIAYIGALSPEKDVGRAIAATAMIDDVQLLVVGDGPERAALQDQADAELAGRHVFSGSVEDTRPALVAADVVVLASRSESMPAVLIEAGLVGKPVVATAVGGIPTIVDDGCTGVLVSPGDTRALGDGLRAILDDPTRARAIGHAAHAKCLDQFALGKVAAEWARVLDAVGRR